MVSDNRVGKGQKKLYWDGEVYKAQPENTNMGGCDGCAFDHLNIGLCADIDDQMGTICLEGERKDRTSIIWVKVNKN